MSLEVRETYVNATKGHQFGDSGWQAVEWTDDRGVLFRALQKEYGRAVSMYRDPGSLGGRTRTVGWVFTKRMRYEDARGRGPDDHYIREVWVEVRERPTGILDDPRLGQPRTRLLGRIASPSARRRGRR